MTRAEIFSPTNVLNGARLALSGVQSRVFQKATSQPKKPFWWGPSPEAEAHFRQLIVHGWALDGPPAKVDEPKPASSLKRPSGLRISTTSVKNYTQDAPRSAKASYDLSSSTHLSKRNRNDLTAIKNLYQRTDTIEQRLEELERGMEEICRRLGTLHPTQVNTTRTKEALRASQPAEIQGQVGNNPDYWP
ncbi:MAG: hypothetical protein M1831_007500 [Alyxoria varia]|nr:MAG: hypothetical protein M1831_007500 [Alyxoria varia]